MNECTEEERDVNGESLTSVHFHHKTSGMTQQSLIFTLGIKKQLKTKCLISGHSCETADLKRKKHVAHIKALYKQIQS